MESAGIIAFDGTLVFQIVNIICLLAMIIGLSYIVIRSIKKKKEMKESMKRIEEKIDTLLKEK